MEAPRTIIPDNYNERNMYNKHGDVISKTSPTTHKPCRNVCGDYDHRAILGPIRNSCHKYDVHEDNKHCRRGERLSRDSPKRCMSPSSNTVLQAIDYPSPINAPERRSVNSNEPQFWRRASRSRSRSRSRVRSRIRSQGVKSDCQYNYRLRSHSNSIDPTPKRTCRPYYRDREYHQRTREYHQRTREYHERTPSRYVTIIIKNNPK